MMGTWRRVRHWLRVEERHLGICFVVGALIGGGLWAERVLHYTVRIDGALVAMVLTLGTALCLSPERDRARAFLGLVAMFAATVWVVGRIGP